MDRHKGPISSTFTCPVAAKVALRPACVGCNGRPDSNQHRLDRGDVLVRQSDPARHVFAIVSGWLREGAYDADGHTTSARLIGPGQVLGLASLTGGADAAPPRHLATITVLTPTRVCIIAANDARAWLSVRPEEAFGLALMAVGELDAMRHEMSLRALPAELRVLALVEDFVAADGGDAGRWTRLPATREQLGEVLGLTLETVSRMLQRLARRGVIEVRGRDVRLVPTDSTKA